MILKTIDSTADFSVVFSCNPHTENEILQIFWKIDVIEMYAKSVKYTCEEVPLDKVVG